MMNKTNCPNCGMPIVGEKCEYCGTVFIDFACLDADKPFYIKVRHGNKILRAKCIASYGITIKNDMDYTSYYSDNAIIKPFVQNRACMDMHLDFLTDVINGTDCLYEVIDTEVVDQDTLKEVIK